MKRLSLVGLFVIFMGVAYGQQIDTVENNTSKVMIRGYGEVHYNQPFSSDKRYNGSLDVHRMVMMLGYSFSSRTSFMTEIEYEHVKELYVEQAYSQHRISSNFSLVGGLILVPMGFINEYHEPTVFNGVERPLIDNNISPSTWREIAFGFKGNSIPLSLDYQFYIVNGFKSYSTTGLLNGKSGFRSGRQRGAEAIASSPNFAGRVHYYGIKGLQLGLSGYYGKTQSPLYNGIEKNDNAALAKADSSVVGLAMVGFDAQYDYAGLELRSQLYLSSISNSDEYNRFTAKSGVPNDLGESMYGYYVEAAYNVLRPFGGTKYQLLPFARFEKYDTHWSVGDVAAKNDAYNVTAITAGLTLRLAKGAVVKTDIQLTKPKSADEYSKVLNFGIGVSF